MKDRWMLSLILIVCLRAQAELRGPAFTAYLDPNPEGTAVLSRASTRHGEKFTRPALAKPPTDIVLPPIPTKSARCRHNLPASSKTLDTLMKQPNVKPDRIPVRALEDGPDRSNP